MTMKLSKQAYINLINEDIQALQNSNTTKLEMEHIIQILKDSINFYYPENNVIIDGKTAQAVAMIKERFPDGQIIILKDSDTETASPVNEHIYELKAPDPIPDIYFERPQKHTYKRPYKYHK